MSHHYNVDNAKQINDRSLPAGYQAFRTEDGSTFYRKVNTGEILANHPNSVAGRMHRATRKAAKTVGLGGHHGNLDADAHPAPDTNAAAPLPAPAGGNRGSPAGAPATRRAGEGGGGGGGEPVNDARSAGGSSGPVGFAPGPRAVGELEDSGGDQEDGMLYEFEGAVKLERQLPDGWVAFHDDAFDRVYYYNVQTEQSVWEFPTSSTEERSLLGDHSAAEVESEGADAPADPDKLVDLRPVAEGWSMRVHPDTGCWQFVHEDTSLQDLYDGAVKPAEPLPPGWVCFLNEEGNEYYLHAASGTTAWEHPASKGYLTRMFFTVPEERFDPALAGEELVRLVEDCSDQLHKPPSAECPPDQTTVPRSGLGDGWVPVKSTKHKGAPFFLHLPSNETSWEHPSAHGFLLRNRISSRESDAQTKLVRAVQHRDFLAVTQLVDQYAQLNPYLATMALRGVNFLLRDPENRQPFVAMHVHEALLFAMQALPHSRSVFIEALAAVARMAVVEDVCNELHALKVGDALRAAIKGHGGDLKVQQAFMWAAVNLSAGSRERSGMLMSIGLGPAMMSAVTGAHAGDALLLHDTLGATFNVCNADPDIRARLENVGLADVLVTALVQGDEESHLIQHGFLAAAEFATGSESRKAALLAAGIGKVVVKALRMHVDDVGVVESALACAVRLCFMSDERATALLDLGLGECLFQVLARHAGHVAVQFQGLKLAMSACIGSEQRKNQLMGFGLPGAVARAMQELPESTEVQEEATVVISIYSFRSQERKAQFMAVNAASLVVDAMRRHGERADVQQYGLGAARNLSSGSERRKNEFVELGVIQLLCVAMARHEDHAGVQQFGLGLAVNLSSGSDDRCDQLVTEGFCQLQMAALRRHRDQPGVQEEGLAVAVNLLSGSEQRCAYVRDLGFVGELLAALSAHPAHVGVQQSGLGAAKNLMADSEDSKVELMRAGFDQALIDALDAHLDHPGVQQDGLGAAVNLMSGSDFRKKRLVDLGFAQRLVASLNTHVGHPGVQEEGLGAAVNVTIGSSKGTATQNCAGRCRVLLHADFPDTLVRSLRLHPTNPGVQMYGLGVVKNLCVADPDVGENLIQLKIDALVMAALREHASHPFVSKYGWGAMSMLIRGHEDRKDLFARAGCCELLGEGLLMHGKVPKVQEEMLMVMALLSCGPRQQATSLFHKKSAVNDGPEFRASLLMRANGLQALVNTLRAQSNQPLVQRAGMAVAANIMSTSEERKNALLKLSFISCVLHALKKHHSSKEVVKNALGAVANLSTGDNRRSEKLVEEHVGRAVVNAISSFPSCERVQEEGFATLCNLALENADRSRQLANEGALTVVRHALVEFSRNTSIMFYVCHIARELVHYEGEHNAARVLGADMEKPLSGALFALQHEVASLGLKRDEAEARGQHQEAAAFREEHTKGVASIAAAEKAVKALSNLHAR